MDLADRPRLGQVQQVVVAPEIVIVIGEALAAEVLLGDAEVLDHRAHRAVEQHDALAERALERPPLHALAHRRCSAPGTGSARASRGVTPMMRQIARESSARFRV